MRAWAPVEAGDAVAVVAPSSPIRVELLEAGLAEVRALGFEPVVAPDVGERGRFSAGPVERRLRELRRAFEDPQVRAVWAARGGYGLTPLLCELPSSLVAADPKPVIGESDATALGCWAESVEVPWLHGPMVASTLRKGGEGYDRSSLVGALAGEALSFEAGHAVQAGEGEGRLWGGCLTLLTALIGTPWLRRPDGPHLLLIEDVGVKPYQVHRMLVQLRDGGYLGGLQGVVLGDFSGCVQHEGQGYTMDEVFADFFAGLPVTSGWPVGHAEAPHLTIPLGLQARLSVPAGGAGRLDTDGLPR
jgi:muramoyltetrapeptide carboxypeptidase